MEREPEGLDDLLEIPIELTGSNRYASPSILHGYH